MDHMLQFLLHHPYPVVGLVALIEGPLVAMASGVGFALGYINPVIVFALVWFGALVQDLVFYGVGRLAERSPRVRWFAQRTKLAQETLVPLEVSWRREMLLTLLFAKLSYGLYPPLVVAAGMAKAPFWRFLALSMGIEAPLDWIWIGIGYAMARSYGASGRLAPYVTTALGLAAVFGLYRLIRHARRSLSARQAPAEA